MQVEHINPNPLEIDLQILGKFGSNGHTEWIGSLCNLVSNLTHATYYRQPWLQIIPSTLVLYSTAV